MTTKSKIVDYLHDRGIELSPLDDAMIDELLYSMKIIKMAKADIKENGIIVPHGQTVKPNPAVNIYQMAMTNIKDISRKLGLSLRDRNELKLVEEDDDGFDD